MVESDSVCEGTIENMNPGGVGHLSHWYKCLLHTPACFHILSLWYELVQNSRVIIDRILLVRSNNNSTQTS